MNTVTPEELLQQELEQTKKEHEHHHPTAAALTGHLIANLAVLWTKLHQYHWYVKGPQFFTLHSKFEELYHETAAWYDKMAETLLALGAKPFSTTAENVQYTFIQEDPADKYRTADEMVSNIVADFSITRDVTSRAILVADEEGNTTLADVLTSFKAELEKQIWMFQAFLGKNALEEEEE